jgi:hypothetical protein
MFTAAYTKSYARMKEIYSNTSTNPNFFKIIKWVVFLMLMVPPMFMIGIIIFHDLDNYLYAYYPYPDSEIIWQSLFLLVSLSVSVFFSMNIVKIWKLLSQQKFLR